MLDRFFAINRDVCKKLERYLPQAKLKIFSLYERIIAQYINSSHNQIILDIGGGKSCRFAKYRNPDVTVKIIAVDVSLESLKNNQDVDVKIVADVAQGLPFKNERVDLVVSRAVLEHLENIETFIIDSRRILKKNGYFIHLFPSKFAPFAIINQFLPEKLSRKLLYFFKPKSKGICGFPSFYKKCYYSAIKSLLERCDFEVVQMHFGFYQSPYFNFFVPLFLLSAIYEILLLVIGAKNLCAYVLVVAKKK